MATTNTTKSWLWYIRQKGKNSVLGIVDENGAASTSALTVEYWYQEIPDEIESDNDSIPIPSQYEHALAMGVVYEIMRMHGKSIRSYKEDFERGIYDAIHTQIEESQQPMIISPLNLRNDQANFRTESPLE